MKKYLIIGGDSFIGQSLFRYINQIENNISIDKTTRRSELLDKHTYFLNLSDPEVSIPDKDYDTVFFCAGITSIQECEDKRELAELCNYTNTIKLFHDIKKLQSRIIFPSTSLVFDGHQKSYNPTDQVNPQTRYGYLKARAEKMLQESEYSYSIIRCTKLLSSKQSVLHNWINALRSGNKITAFDDMLFSPVIGMEAIKYIYQLSQVKQNGIWHISAKDEISYYDAACYMAELLGVDKNRVIPEKTHNKPVVYNPEHTVLDMSDTLKALNIQHQKTARETLREFVLNFK